MTRDPVDGARPGSGAGTAARSAGCTRSCSTGRCSTRSRGCPRDEARLSPKAARARLAALGLRRPGGGAAAPGGPDRRGVAGPRTSSARCCRRCSAGSRTRPNPDAGLFGLPADLRGARLDALVPPDAARRGPGRAAAGAACWPPAATPPTCCSGRPEGVQMLAQRRGLQPLGRAALQKEMVARGPPAPGPGRGGHAPCGRSGAASCSGSRSPTCSGSSTSAGRATPSPTSTAATLGGGAARRDAAPSRPSGARRCRPGWPSSRWAASAATSSASAATPT